MGEHPDSLRIRAALRGELDAIAGLVEDLTPVVQSRVARALLKSGRGNSARLRPEVEDACQEIMAQLFVDDGRLLLAWQPERGLSLGAFVGLIAQRQVLSLLRSRRRSPFSAEPTDPVLFDNDAGLGASSDTSGNSEAKEMLRLVSHRLEERLSPAGLEMFYRLYVWEQSPDEVSQETGLSVEAIYQWRSRIRKAAVDVQRELSNDGPAANPRPEERAD
jgi:RNA polymerase sigma-70 factor (ECF subfamily)